MKLAFRFVSTIIVATACSSTPPVLEPDAGVEPDAAREADARTTASRHFQHRLPDCSDEDGLFNCRPRFELCADDRVFMRVTDVQNRGTYADDGTHLRLMFESADVPKMQVFTYEADGTVVDDWAEWTWSPAPTEMFSSCD